MGHGVWGMGHRVRADGTWRAGTWRAWKMESDIQLERLSLHCNFGENLNDAVRDRLVCGLKSESIQKRLLSETELEVKKAVALAVAMETAAKDSIELRNRGQREVNKLSRRPEQRKDAYVRPSNNRNDNEVPGDFCFRCGKRHNPETCYFKNEECHNCHRRGHIARKCLQRRKAPTFGQRPWKTNKVHTVDQESEGDSDLADSVIANIGVTKKDELSVYDGCLLWGMRVIVPQPLRERVLDQVHEGHIGMVKMKALARSYVWWPSIDKDIEHSVKGCVGCQLHQNMPQAAPLHPWEWPSGPWQRIHIDYAGPFLGSMFLVVVDAHSKWPESFVMKSTTSQQTIQKLREIFSRNGLPEQLASDNASSHLRSSATS